MAMFNSSKLFWATPDLISQISADVAESFQDEGFEVHRQILLSGGSDISIAKGGVFKSVLGMKTALKISILPRDGNIYAEAGVGIFGEQAIPTIVSFFFLWPVILTQLWGIVQQSKLDDRALDKIAKSIERHCNLAVVGAGVNSDSTFCQQCGNALTVGARFCSKCGFKIDRT